MKYVGLNQKAWEEVAPRHAKARPRLAQEIVKTGFMSLTINDQIALKKYKIAGKRVAHLCCNNGKDTISLTKLGAKSAVGFDFSHAAILEAKELQKLSKAPCKFVHSDVYKINKQFNNHFDIVYMNVGGLVWLPDLKKLLTVVKRILKPGGIYFLHEIHPITSVLDIASFGSKIDYQVKKSYFQKTPHIFESGLDYLNHENYSGEPAYYFSHALGEVVTEAIQAGFNIKSLTEYPEDVSAVLEHMEKDKILPLSYILVAEKPKR